MFPAIWPDSGMMSNRSCSMRLSHTGRTEALPCQPILKGQRRGPGFAPCCPYCRLSVNTLYSYIACQRASNIFEFCIKTNELMNSFLKFFFASILALFVFSIMAFFMLFGFLSGLATPEKEKTGAKAVLLIDMAVPYPELTMSNPFGALAGGDNYDIPSLYDVVRLIHHAKSDSAIKGIYIKCGNNASGFANSDEIRSAIVDFKATGNFVYAYADVITQGGYYVGNCADKIYCNPKGGLDWRGYAVQLAFLKGMLQKLEIEPQIFYAGQFKSATEPFRETEMTDANRLQLTELLNDLYAQFLTKTATSRKLDTAALH